MAVTYILRHGQTEWNRDRRVQGQADSVLTALGQAHAATQGRLLAPVLAAQPKIALHASPLQRTRQTAQIALAGHLDRVVWDDRLMEVHVGLWQGHLSTDLAARYPIFTDGTPTFIRCVSAPEGESFDDLMTRVTAFAALLNDDTIVVTHGITGAALRGHLCGLTMDQMADLDLGQGVVYRIENGVEQVLSED